jgi:hypothetical protein
MLTRMDNVIPSPIVFSDLLAKATSYHFKDLVRRCLEKPTKTNILRLLAYPIVKLKPNLRQSIVIVATKVRGPVMWMQERR